MASKHFDYEAAGMRKGTPFRKVYGYDPEKPNNILAQQVKPQWVDADMVKYQIIDVDATLGRLMYRVYFRVPSAQSVQNECYFCPGISHNPKNPRCGNPAYEKPTPGEIVNIFDPTTRVRIIQVRDHDIKGRNKAGTAVIEVYPDALP